MVKFILQLIIILSCWSSIKNWRSW